MQDIREANNFNKVNSNFSNKMTLSTARNNNSKVDISKDINNYFESTTNSNSDFDPKHVSKIELQAIVKRVKRERQKKLDEENWQKFLRWKQTKVAATSSDDGVSLDCVVGGGSTALSQPQKQEQCKEMPKIEEDEIQGGNHITSTLGAGITDNIGHTYQLGGVLTKRLQDLVATVGRMTSLLLSSVTTRTVQYEDEDVERAIKRSLEFDAMFARNHLYEIQRLLKDAKQLAAGKSPRTDLESKTSAALKCVTQAIQVYAKHVSKGTRVKYQQVVPIFQSISTIHGLLEQLTGEHVFPFRKELEVSCSYMKQLLLEMSTTDTQTVSTVSRKPVKPKPVTRNKPSADLSMYNRRRGDWRRKSASLAHAKFGSPFGKKYGPDKESTNAKQVQYRNATRGVPEDGISTMMEMIPNELMEDGELCLDDSTFKALKQLNSIHNASCHEQILQSQKSPTSSKLTSARSVKGEPNNVQLICLREEDNAILKPTNTRFQDAYDSEIKENNKTTLTIDEQAKIEAWEFHKNMIQYHNNNSHYKDGKALGIVDRLATCILTEMVMDFQKEEMNNVIQTLYSLEFE